MNIIFGIVMLWIAYNHMRDAIDPNRVTRSQVRWNSSFLCLLTTFLGLAFLGFFGAPA